VIATLRQTFEFLTKTSTLAEGRGRCPTQRKQDLAGGLGFEPRLAESESAVLPLDDPPSAAGESPPGSGGLISEWKDGG
jgi:hypothetical protein